MCPQVAKDLSLLPPEGNIFLNKNKIKLHASFRHKEGSSKSNITE
jgi:hypothetical protein